MDDELEDVACFEEGELPNYVLLLLFEEKWHHFQCDYQVDQNDREGAQEDQVSHIIEALDDRGQGFLVLDVDWCAEDEC